MMLLCDRHGCQMGIEVSPDLCDRVARSETVDGIVEIGYEYDGELMQVMFLSKEFAARHGVSESRVSPLPDDYPDWVRLIAVECKKCALECGILQENHPIIAP